MRRAPVKDARRSPSSRNRRAEREPTQDRRAALSAARAVKTETEFPVGRHRRSVVELGSGEGTRHPYFLTLSG